MCNIMIQSRFRTRKPLELLLRYITIPLCRLDFIALLYIHTHISLVLLLLYCLLLFQFIAITFYSLLSFIYSRLPSISYSHQYASTRFTKDAFNGLLLPVSQPMLNHPEQHKRCFIIGLKGTHMENVQNVENKLKAIMELLDSIADGVTSR